MKPNGTGRERFFAPCPRGLEGVLADELRELVVDGLEPLPGGVPFLGSLEDAWRVNLRSRIASRVLWQVARAPYRSADDLYKLALRTSWPDLFDPSHTLRVDTTAIRSPLKSLEFATLRIKDGVCDRMRRDLGRRPSIDTKNPGIRVASFLEAEVATLYVDLSGEPLFKRGWRQDVGEAPLRENLAAGILRLAGWKTGMALMDPMCGSGTFIVEAAQIILGIDAGARRSFGFENLRHFNAAAWQAMRAQASPTSSGAARDGGLRLWASDVSGDAVAATRANLVRVGLSESQALEVAPKQIDARHVKAPEPGGILVTNPPYGERLDVRGAETDTFFKEFGDNLKARFAGWTAYLLSPDMDLPGRIRLAAARRTPLFNGNIECRLFRFDVVAGRHGRAAAAASEAAKAN